MLVIDVMLGFLLGLLAAGIARADEDTPAEEDEQEEEETPEMSEYKVQLAETENIPAPDDLVQGEYEADEIKLSTAGTYKRGTLLMYDTDTSSYKNATSAGVSSADDVCILCDDVTVPSGDYVITAGYYRGRFRGDAVILPYEQESDNHGTLIAAIKGTLRKQGIFLV